MFVSSVCWRGRTITLKVKYADFESVTRRQTLAGAINDVDALKEQAYRLLNPVFPSKKAIRLLGVSLSSFGNEEGGEKRQMQLVI